jgi:hypothetical protein
VYIRDLLQEQMQTLPRHARRGGLSAYRGRGELDYYDPDGQSLLLRYTTITAVGKVYIRGAIKIESVAKSAFYPDAPVTVRPFIAGDLGTVARAPSDRVTETMA